MLIMIFTLENRLYKRLFSNIQNIEKYHNLSVIYRGRHYLSIYFMIEVDNSLSISIICKYF